jgi:hypothetical protein
MPHTASDLLSNEHERPSGPLYEHDHPRALETPSEPTQPQDPKPEQDATAEIMEDAPRTPGNDQHPDLPNLRSALTTSLASPGGIEMDENPVHNREITEPDHDAEVTDEASGNKSSLPSKGPVNEEFGQTNRISFARTVPHMNWGEDDEVDPEWNLQRTDTDPFKMMAPTDRTNSFPQVPQSIPENSSPRDATPPDSLREIPSTKGFSKDLFGEDETNDDDFFSKTDNPDIVADAEAEGRENEWLNNHGGVAAEEDFERAYGGDVQDEPDFEARYEEGMPLVVDSEHAEHEASTNLQESSTTPALFDDEDPSQEDDFFSGIGGNSELPTSQHQSHPSLERKSTMQVMNSLEQAHDEPPALTESQDDLNSSQSSLEKVTGGGIAVSRSTIFSKVLSEVRENDTAADARQPSEEDLAAKWKAALDGDEFLDDEDLLEDEPAPEVSSIDLAAVFGSDDEGFLEDDDEPTESGPTSQAPPMPVIGTNGYSAQGSDSRGVARPGSSSNNRYLPPNAAQAQASLQQPSNPYQPTAPILGDFSTPAQTSNSPYGQGYTGAIATPSLTPFGMATQPPRPEMPKSSQSFADKSKGGYSSPYDLPMEVVKPRKRPSMQQMSRGYNNVATPPAVAPPRSTSMYSQRPASSQEPEPNVTPSGIVEQLHQRPSQPPQMTPTGSQPPVPTLRNKSSFFEELPMSSKPKPSGRYTPQPISPIVDPHSYQNNAPYPGPGVGSVSAPPLQQLQAAYSQSHPAPPYNAPPQQQAQYSQPPPVQGLVSPPKVSPYGNLSSGIPQPSVPNRYSPAPSQQSSRKTPPPPLAQGRYATAPPAQRQPSLQGGLPPPAPPSAPFAHQPRTSSPLAHFERSQDQRPYSGPHPAAGTASHPRQGSSHYDHASRAPNLPVTEEVDEQVPNEFQSYGQFNQANPELPHVSQHAQEYQHEGSLSPSKRSMSGYEQRYGSISHEQVFVPPQRSQTQSPGRVMAGPRGDMSIAEPIQRPLSVHGPASPKQIHDGFSAISASAAPGVPQTRSRGFSQLYNHIAPTDGRENDPLQRWRGGPVFAWGVGGTVVTSFPKEIPVYGRGQTQPQIMVSPGEVKIRNLKEIYPLDERLASFPGPLKSKAKKKEILGWLSTGIEILDGNNEYLRSLPSLSHEDKRGEERVILWKILRVMVENDGLLEGNDSVSKAVRAVLSPGLDSDVVGAPPQYTTGAELTGIFRSAGSAALADPVDPAAVDQLRKFLLRGEREKAVWEAVDKRLWAHAMLISNTVSKDLYKQVAQEFVQKEVKSVGENTESLAALYEVFAGNFEEVVDELVPPSARAGFQMMSTSGTTGPSKSSLDGLDRWRETLGLILSNRSENDNQAINALGKLLSGYGRAEAAHICFIFGRSQSVFGGADDPLSNIVLVGSDHHRQPYEFDKELEPILLSEVYEFALTLSNTSNMPISIPHLSVYKLQHATILTQFGQREKALQYCEAIATSVTSQTRRSPYHHSLLVAAVDDLSTRLKQSPKDGSSSWISKPSIDKVSTSVWSKFNKFVAGDENDAAGGPGSEAGSDIGPFSRIAGGTPTISRSPSNAELYGSYNGGSVNGTLPPAATRAGSRYAPGSGYTPPGTANEPAFSAYGSPPQQQSSFGQRRSFEDRRSSEDTRPQYREVSTGSYQGGQLSATRSNYSLNNSYAPSDQASYATSLPTTPIFDPNSSNLQESPPSMHNSGTHQNYVQTDSYNSNAAPSFNSQPSSFYEQQSGSSQNPPSNSGYEPPSNSGYEPPSSSGYEPPSYEPATMDDEPDSPTDTRPKKKSFIDDDEDEPISRPAEKTKAEKDREAAEAFRKAAEADGKSQFHALPK